MAKVPSNQKSSLFARSRTLVAALGYFVFKLTPATLRQLRTVQCVFSELAPHAGGSAEDARTVRKLRTYAVMLPLIAYEYAEMCGRRIREEDRELAVILSAQIMLQDAVLDDKPAGEFLPALYNRIENEVKRRLDPQRLPLYKELLSRFYDLQHRSLRQSDPAITPEEIREISRKGGITLVLSIFPFQPSFADRELAAIEDLGTWLQYVDDLADKDEDTRSSVYTVATHPETRDGAFREAEVMRRRAFQGVRNLGFSPRATERFLFHYYAMLVTYHSYYSIPAKAGSLHRRMKQYDFGWLSGTWALAVVMARSARALSLYER